MRTFIRAGPITLIRTIVNTIEMYIYEKLVLTQSGENEHLTRF